MSNPNGHLVHGLCYTPLYGVWEMMKQRCYNPRCRGYKWYGAKGITVCEEWQKFKPFHAWATAAGYQPGLTIDRIDNAKGYSPDNCRWVSLQVQMSNRTSNRVLEYHGEKRTLTEWSELLGINRTTLSARINKLGWSVERALGGSE